MAIIHKDNNPSPESLRLEAAKLKNKAEKIRWNAPKYIEQMKQVWILNTQAASLED
jgi:hypothetical protein